MRLLSPAPRGDMTIYYAAARSMGRPQIADYEAPLLGRFQTFRDSIGKLHSLAAAESPLREIHDDLKRLYDCESADLISFKEKIRHAFGPGCPYCGEYCSTPEIDHYLPRTKYGEYSLFAPNLVPSCGPCNRKLSDRVAQGEDYLQPFFDDFLGEPTMQVSFDWSVDPLAIRLECSDQLRGSDRSRVERHMKLIGIRNRFARWAVGELSRYGRMYNDRDITHIASDLARQETSYRPNPGPNVWPALLARAVLADGEMLGFLSRGLT